MLKISGTLHWTTGQIGKPVPKHTRVPWIADFRFKNHHPPPKRQTNFPKWTHQKRFEEPSLEYFAFYANKPFTERNFFETCHCVKDYGVGLDWWREDPKWPQTQRFRLKRIEWTFRPFYGKEIGDLYINGKKIRACITAPERKKGSWKYEEGPTSSAKLPPPFPQRYSETVEAVDDSETSQTLAL
eukprot:Filipodium_phascolosomae@DN2174_c0_g1_i4.p1